MEPADEYQTKLAGILAADTRYPIQAYQWLHVVLERAQATQRNHDGPLYRNHVGGEQLLSAFREVTLEEFGPMAASVLRGWGLTRTEDFGNLVFNMIGAELLSASAEDSPSEYADGFDFRDVFEKPFEASGPPPELLPPIDVD